MNSRVMYWAGIVLLVVLGICFLLFYKDPFPANHEAIGLGALHIVHDITPVILLAGAGFLVWKMRRTRATATT